ncbi:MAG: Hsp20/alpha crystallin family protein [Spirochaetaceae bacterium]|nr:Hsp20/alpha crystallin family protein [Spirochaetaceae bacterium]
MSDEKELQKVKGVPAPCDIFHDNESVILYLEMPGVTKENLQIRVDKDLLIIDGKKETADIEGKYMIHEIRNNDFHQEYTIDDTIDRNNINAVIKNGIVTLSLGVIESEKPRKIQITAG